MVSLHQTQIAWNRDERNRINENWQTIVESFATIQRQINILAGDGEVDELLARIEQALQRAETAVNEYIEQVDVEVKQAIQDNNAATQTAVTNVNNAIAEVNKVLQDARGLITETNTAKDAAITATNNANEATSNTNAATEAANTATSEANAAIASITELLQTVNDALELVVVRTEEARTATEAANKAAKEADTQAFNAENAMQDAITAASRANEAADQVAGWGTTVKWDAETQFEKNNTVSDEGQTWQAKRANKGVKPVEGEDWTLIAKKGTDGKGSVSSVNGVGPDAEGNVQLTALDDKAEAPLLSVSEDEFLAIRQSGFYMVDANFENSFFPKSDEDFATYSVLLSVAGQEGSYENIITRNIIATERISAEIQTFKTIQRYQVFDKYTGEIHEDSGWKELGASSGGGSGSILLGTSSTSSTTKNKIATVPGYEGPPKTGDHIAVHFSQPSTATLPTLDVNGTGAYNIYQAGARTRINWGANEVVEFIFVEGNGWHASQSVKLATHNEPGITSLSSATDSESESNAATPRAIKIVNDKTNRLDVFSSLLIAEETAPMEITLPVDVIEENKLYTFLSPSHTYDADVYINQKRLYKPGTTTSPTLVPGKAYTIWYNSTSDAFFIKASAEGNALASHVLEGKSFSNNEDIGISGNMADYGGVGKKAGWRNPGGDNIVDVYVTSNGYYNTDSWFEITDENLIPANILNGKTIFGVTGSAQTGFEKISGTIASSTTQMAFQNTVGTNTVTRSYVDVPLNIMGFTPSIVRVKPINFSSSDAHITVYTSDYASYVNSANYGNILYSGYVLRLPIVGGVLRLPVSQPNTIYEWQGWE